MLNPRRAALLLFVCFAASVAAAEVPHQTNATTPRDGVQVLPLTEVWHRGHDDDDLIFGAVNTVALGPDGNIYVLDQQQSQVFVFSPTGEELRILSREGEGPGESRRPEDLVFLPDGSLGLVQYINGKIIRIDLEGVPLGSWMPPGYSAEGGGLGSIRRARYRAGSFVINGARIQPAEQGMVRTQYLVRCNLAAETEAEYLSRATASQLMRDGWIEKNHYFPSHERWDIDHQGQVLAANERNEYLVTVYDRSGQPVRSFGREHRAWRRTAAEKQEIRDALTVIRDGERVDVRVEVEDLEPSVLALFVRPDGEIWVLPSGGDKEQAPGVMLTYDVFDAAGVFVRQVAIQCESDPNEDKLVLLDAQRAALIRGAVQARRNTFGGSRGDEAEVAVHDLKIFSF
jgi:hypothetical protein